MKVYKILPDLYISGQFNKRPDKLYELLRLNIGAVLCMLRRGDDDMLHQTAVDYTQVPLPDARYVDTQALGAAVRYVERKHAEGKTVLVHCISAHDRAPLVAAVVVARRLKISGEETIKRMRDRRGNIALRNPAFQVYLRSERWRNL